MSDFQDRLSNFYFQNDIHPTKFKCKYKTICQRYAYLSDMTEAKMSMVGSLYGKEFPRIVVISLDPPSGKDKDGKVKRWEFITPEQRTTKYISSIHESDNYDCDRPNPHWTMTQIIIRDILTLWGYQPRPNSATVLESYLGRPIDNMTKYFSHVNIAKCSMNNPNQRQSPKEVHQLCSNSFLLGEIETLQPEIIISQGATTNEVLGKQLINRKVFTSDLPFTKEIYLHNKPCLWLPMYHPTQQINKIRSVWTTYLNAIVYWKQHNK